MSFVTLLTIFSAFSAINALPVSVLPVRSYVFLAPDLPKFQIQPTQLKAQQGPVLAKSDVSANKQYVLVYPTYQYLTTRQDGSTSTGFFETIQNYFVNFGQSQSDESSAVMDPVEADKPQAAPETVPMAETSQEKPEQRQKIYYSYVTPASTVPLNADRRFYFLAEQPQIYGSFSGPSVNPVFNLQPVPVVVQSRSNVAQVPDEPQPGQVVSENVQKFSQIPPVMAAIEQPQAQVKQIRDPVDAIVDDKVPENRIAPVVVDNRALPISTEGNVVEVSSTVQPVIEARNKPTPIEVTNESITSQVVADEKSEVVDTVQPAVPALKDALPVVAAAVDQSSSGAVEQSVQNSGKVLTDPVTPNV